MGSKKINNIFYIINVITCTLAALFLTCYIDRITLSTNIQKLFVWFYFYAVFFTTLCFMRKKIIAFVMQYKKIIIVCVIGVFGWSFVGGRSFLPQKSIENEVEISIMDEINPSSQGKEAWLLALSLDDEVQSLDTFNDIEQGWIFKENALYGNYDTSKKLVLKFPGEKDIELTFGMHAWSGIVDIESNGFHAKYDLYDEAGNNCIIQIPGRFDNYSGVFQLVLISGFFSLCLIGGEILFFFLQKRDVVKGRKDLKGSTIFIICILSALFTIVSLDAILWQNDDMKISIQPADNNDLNNHPVQILNISLDGKQVDISRMPLFCGWSYNSDEGSLIADSTKSEPFCMFSFGAKKTQICFVGNAEVLKSEISPLGKIQLQKLEMESVGNINIVEVKQNSLNGHVLLCILIIYASWIIFLYVISSFTYTYNIVSFFTPGILAFVIINQKIIEFEVGEILLICLISFVESFLINIIITKKCMKKYYIGKNRLVLFLVSLYTSFSCIGYSLFLSGEYIQASIYSIALFAIFTLWIILAILCMLAILEMFFERVKGYNHDLFTYKNNYFLDRYMICFALFFIWEIILILYFPGNFSPDSIDMWIQALGHGNVTTHHSALLVLITKLLINILKTPFGVMSFQVFVAAWVISFVIVQTRACFRSKYPTIICAILFAFIPSNYKMITTFWKDIPFTLCLVALTCFLYKISERPDVFLASKTARIAMIVSIIGIGEFRHNGILVVIFTLIYLTYLSLKHRKAFFRYFSIVLITVGSIAMLHGPVYNMFNVVTSARTSKPYVTMFAALGSALNKEKGFSEKSEKILFSIMKKDEWIEYYDPFNIDSYRWNPEIESGMDISWVSTKEAFSCYMEGLIKYPDIIIKDRLDGSNIIWDVAQPQEAYNQRYCEGIWFPNGINPEILGLKYTNKEEKTYQPSNKWANWLNYIASGVTKNKILDSLIYRSGIYLIVFFVLLLFCICNRNIHFIIASIPLLGNTMALMLLTAHQSYRYVWYIPVCVFTLFILMVASILGNRDSDCMRE